MKAIRVGLISDTHGLLRPEALAFMRGRDLILHAGDICDGSVLAELGAIAPTTAVRGNNDAGPWASGLRESETVEVGGVLIHIVHDIGKLAIDPAAKGVAVVVFGHSHKPSVESRGGILFVNPGSAGPRRFKLPISVGELVVEDGRAIARAVELRPPRS